MQRMSEAWEKTKPTSKLDPAADLFEAGHREKTAKATIKDSGRAVIKATCWTAAPKKERDAVAYVLLDSAHAKMLSLNEARRAFPNVDFLCPILEEGNCAAFYAGLPA